MKPGAKPIFKTLHLLPPRGQGFLSICYRRRKMRYYSTTKHCLLRRSRTSSHSQDCRFGGISTCNAQRTRNVIFKLAPGRGWQSRSPRNEMSGWKRYANVARLLGHGGQDLGRLEYTAEGRKGDEKKKHVRGRHFLTVFKSLVVNLARWLESWGNYR